MFFMILKLKEDYLPYS